MCTSCAIPNTIEMMEDSAPPPEFGRPLWVRGVAGVGGWAGGIIGGVASIATLPITYPLSEWASDGLSEHSAEELMFMPAIGLSAVGHAVIGVPADMLDWTFRRAWIAPDDPISSFEFTPLNGFEAPKAATDPTDG
ncbi:hypothetical protein N9B90_01970 [bacterium]|nr:hypothetical protein [bacterium]